jgi:hypothetical protein
MERRKFQRIAVMVALIGILFMFGAETKKAEAYMPDTAFSGIVAVFYDGMAIQMNGLGFYYDDYSYHYDEYLYFANATTMAYNAAYYASFSSNYYAYNAYLEAMDAYSYLDSATYYAYDCWYYYDNYSGDLSEYYGGLAAESLAYLIYYSAYL